MTIRHLKTFIAVYESGGITRAAQALHVAQPAVSQTVAEIEKYYGVTLFDRVNNRLILTDGGAKLLAKAREAVASFDDFEALAKTEKSGTAVKIGSSLTIGRRFLPEMLQKIAAEGARPTVVIDNTAKVEELLVSGSLDFAFTEGAPSSRELLARPVYRDELLAVCAPSYSAPESVTIEELSRFPILARESGSASRETLAAAFANSGLALTPLVESASNTALVSCAEAALGVAVLPQALVSEYIAAGRLKRIKIAGFGFSRDYFSVCRKNKRFSPLQQRVFALCESVFKTETHNTD